MPDRSVRPDSSETRFWLSTVAVGGWVTMLMVLAGCVYALWFAESHQLALGALVGLTGVSGVVALWAVPWRRVVAAGQMETVLLAWSLLTIGAVTASAALDGGASSPLILALVLPAIFASLAYSLVRVAAIAAIAELAFLGLCLQDSPGAGFALVFCSTLVGSAVMAVRQASFHQAWRRHLALSSCTDALTGLLNRRGLAGASESAFGQLRRHRREVTLMLIDLDDFKAYNDTHGHQAGDELLRWVAAELQTAVRPSDSVARLGGDEFAVLLPDADPSAVEAVVGRIRETLAQRVEAALGWGTAPQNGTTFDALFRVADRNLYAEKLRADSPAPPNGSPGLEHRRRRRPFSADAILAGITEPFFVLDNDWRFAYINEPAEEILGSSSHELLGQSIWEAFPDSVGSKFEQVALEVAASGEPMRFAEQYVAGGRTFSQMVSPAPGGITVYLHAVQTRARAAPIP